MITEFLTPDPKSFLEMVLAVSLLIILVLFTRKAIAREFGPGLAYALWLLPLARLVMPPLPTGMSWVSLLGLAPALPLTDAATVTTSTATQVFASTGAQSGTMDPISNTLELTPAAPVTADTSFLPGMDMAVSIITVLLAIWLIGALVSLVRNSAAQNDFMKIVAREKVPASPQLQALADDVARQVGLKRTPQIATSLISNGPLVTGLFRPIVLLPAWFETDYDRVQQRAALAHELTHVKRGDLWALQVAELFVACLWFNPLAYMARKAFRTDQEAACDSDVLRCGAASPHAYGSTLLKAVRISVPERLPMAASLPLTHSLKERMRRLAYPAPTKRRRLAGMGLTALLGSVALISTASVTATAGEMKAELTRSLKIDNSTLFINGKKVENRQFVLLGDPIKTPDPAIEAEIAELNHRISLETSKFVVPEAMPPLPPMPVIPPQPPVPPVADVSELDGGAGNHAYSSHDAEKLAAENEAAWDAWEAEYESSMAQWEAEVDHIVSKWEDTYGDDFEKTNLMIETRIDGLTDRLEAKIEAAYGDGQAGRDELVTSALETLALSCRDANLAPGETRILGATGPDGDDFHVACVEGDATRLEAAETVAAITKSDLLCDDEKASFKKRKTSHRTIEINK
ncbi:M56 family metallopeptidase [Hyphomonas oceanitis]|uniref:M56 family metallopeptidase n=1 Tax=Hyphomonas oceanitis TaxID=81033 RepID=UPI0030024F65